MYSYQMYNSNSGLAPKIGLLDGYKHSPMLIENAVVQPWPNAAPGATSGPWPVTLGRVGPQKAQCSNVATYGGTLRIASHIGRCIVWHALSGPQLIKWKK